MSEEDVDRIGDLPVPRERRRLVGHRAAVSSFLQGMASGRLHHAWLIGGAEGIGKATFAFQAVRFLLSGRPATAARDLALPDGDPVHRLIDGLAHPDFLLVRRSLNPDTDKLRASISVEDVRRLSAVFGETAAFDGWRAAIIDSADDMTPAAANALLKLLEEPPKRAIFFVVAHAPARLLPTIRSRCRRVMLQPLDDGEVADVVRDLVPDAPDEAILDALARAGGAPRKALELLDGDRLKTLKAIEAALSPGRRTAVRASHALADQLSRPGADQSLELFVDEARRLLTARVLSGVGEGADLARLARMAALDADIGREAAEVAVYNLDKKSFVLSVLRRITAA